jgi:hypothetical protein
MIMRSPESMSDFLLLPMRFAASIGVVDLRALQFV